MGQSVFRGYRHVWYGLQLKGHWVPRQLVEISLTWTQWKHISIIIVNLMLQHADGYDKLKPYGFPVHGYIVDWRIWLLWMVFTRSNNSPDNVGHYFLDAVKASSRCLHELLGTLSIDDEMGQQHQPEVKFSHMNLLAMHKVVKTLSIPHRLWNSGWFAVIAKTQV